MKDIHTLRELFSHMEWADAVVWRAVVAQPDAAADPLMRERLEHIHMVQRAFLDVWRRASSAAQSADSTDLLAVARAARAYYAEVSAYLTTLDEPALAQPLEVPWARRFGKLLGREPDIPSLGETLLQVAMHSTYHRGQVNARLRELGSEPPLTDFIVWVWLGKPQADWPTSVSAPAPDNAAQPNAC